jgi:PAS domain S-box-containing protein
MSPETIHILLVEDSEMHSNLIGESFFSGSAHIHLTTVSTLAAARAFLVDHVPDLALIDLILPDGKGTELLCANREQAKFPAVLLSASGDEKTAVEAMKAGALDYLVKGGTTLAELPMIVDRTLREWDHIVRRRAAEEALQRSEEKYRRLFENMREGVAVDRIIYDEEGRPVDWVVTDINPAYEEVVGIPRERAVGRRASELYGEVPDLESVLGVYAGVAETGKPAQLEFFFPISQKYILISVFSLGDGQFATMTRDMTTRKRMEVERERLLAEQEAILNAIADAVIIYDLDGMIRHMNPAAERMFGYSSVDRAKPLEERISLLKVETPEGKPFDLKNTIGRAVAGETMKGVIAVLRRPEGKDIWMCNSAAAIYTPDGKRAGAVGTSADITALHDLQVERDLYLHTISHDLRIPLTVIQGYAQLLQETLRGDAAGDRSRPICAEIMKGTRRMGRMIEDLVETARLEGGPLTLEKEGVNVAVFFRHLAASHAGVIDEERLRIDTAENLPEVPVDRHRLERILVNLLTNAQKYSPPESPVRLRAQPGEGEILLSVSDCGQGIAPEDQSHIFERFYRPEGSRRSDSVGLGLYITRMLVEAHGGRIWVESQPGKGTIFFFTLPVGSGDVV